MIVARLKKAGDITGSCTISGYPKEKGWFPVNSFNFGFNAKEETKNGGGSPGTRGTSGNSSSGNSTGRSGASRTGSSGNSSSGQSGTPSEPPRDFTGMNISKEIDAATCYLMSLAMQERKSKKGAEGKQAGGKVTADIHVLSSMKDSTGRHYAILKIHLAGVIVQQWSINGSGEERPTEELELRYDKAAMLYCWTPDGKNFTPIGPKSWDQDKNDVWTEMESRDAFNAATSPER